MSAEQAALTSLPPDLDPAQWVDQAAVEVVLDAELVEVEDGDRITATITRPDQLPVALVALDQADRAAAKLRAIENAALADAFGAVVARAAERERRAGRPGEFSTPLRVSAVHVFNRVSPWWDRRVRVGTGPTILRRVVYFERVTADNRRAERHRRVVVVRHPRWAPRRTTVALTLAVVAAAGSWGVWWLVTHWIQAAVLGAAGVAGMVRATRR